MRGWTTKKRGEGEGGKGGGTAPPSPPPSWPQRRPPAPERPSRARHPSGRRARAGGGRRGGGVSHLVEGAGLARGRLEEVVVVHVRVRGARLPAGPHNTADPPPPPRFLDTVLQWGEIQTRARERPFDADPAVEKAMMKLGGGVVSTENAREYSSLYCGSPPSPPRFLDTVLDTRLVFLDTSRGEIRAWRWTRCSTPSPRSPCSSSSCSPSSRCGTCWACGGSGGRARTRTYTDLLLPRVWRQCQGAPAD